MDLQELLKKRSNITFFREDKIPDKENYRRYFTKNSQFFAY